MKVRFTATAFAEINEIHDYIAKDNPTAAKAVILRVEQVIARIARFPNIARVIDPSGVRVFPVAPFPYLLFYTVEAHEVIIRNVRHGSVGGRARNREASWTRRLSLRRSASC